MREHALTADRHAYWARVREVDGGSPSCGAKGHHHAKCILPPGHVGDLHEGNGFDNWGPKYVCWEAKTHRQDLAS